MKKIDFKMIIEDIKQTYKLKSICEKMGMTYSNFQLKAANGKFTLKEILILSEYTSYSVDDLFISLCKIDDGAEIENMTCNEVLKLSKKLNLDSLLLFNKLIK